MRKLLKNRSGTAEIVGTVLFLLILFFFFSNVFLWHNQVTREMDQLVADKTNSAVSVGTSVLLGEPVHASSEDIEMGKSVSGNVGSTWSLDRNCRVIKENRTSPSDSYSLNVRYTFNTGVDTAEKKRLTADLRLSVYAKYTSASSDDLESCLIYVLDPVDAVPVSTGLIVQSSYSWSNTTLTLASKYIDDGGSVTIVFLDASSVLGYTDSDQGMLSIDYMEVCADPIGLIVTNLGGTDATLSRLWIVDAANHVPYDLNDTVVAGGSTGTIVFSTEPPFVGESSDLVVNYAPPAGQTVIFRVLTTLGNTAACSIVFQS
jgi:hypothetical protein